MNYHKELEALQGIIVEAVTIDGIRFRHVEYNTGMAGGVYPYWEEIPEMEDFYSRNFLPQARLRIDSIPPNLGFAKTSLAGRVARRIVGGYDALTLYVQEEGSANLIKANRLVIPAEKDPYLIYFSYDQRSQKRKLVYERDIEYFYDFFQRATLWDCSGPMQSRG